jgi:AcrR family transcriptional regulator
VAASSKSRKKLLTDFRRDEIIAAALKIFGSKGFAATRAEDIASQAGIGKGTIYLYFRSKEDIYAAAVQHAIGQLNDRILSRLDVVDNIRKRIEVYVTVRLEFWLEQKSLYRLLLTLGRESKHRKQTNAVLRLTTQSLIDLFEEGVAAGELKPQPFEALAWAVVDMVRGANERRLDGVAIHPIEEDAMFIAGITIRLLGIEELDGSAGSKTEADRS